MAGVLSIALHVGCTALCGTSTCFFASLTPPVLFAARPRSCAHSCRLLALVPARQSHLVGPAFGHGLRDLRADGTVFGEHGFGDGE